MNILAFDTSTDIMYVTLGKDNSVSDSRMIQSTEQSYNSAFLISTMADILIKNNFKPQDIEAIGVNIGPGSFTGLRASATVARVFAQQAGIPVIGTASFEVYSKLNNTGKNALCLMDARRGKAYAGIYDKNTNPVSEPCALEYQKAMELAKSSDFFIISDERMSGRLRGEGLEFVCFQQERADFGGFLLELTAKKLRENASEKFKWYNLKPLYIQPPPISMPKK